MSTSIDEYEEYAAWYAESGERLSPAEYPMARALQTGAPVEPVELKIRRFDGTDGIVLISATPTRDTQGLVTGAVVINVDITDRKRAETALREAEQKYRELVQFAPTGIYEINFQTNRLTSVNEAMIETLGYSREELLAMNPLDLLDAEDRAPFQARITRWLNGEAPDDNVEYRVKRRDGSTLHAVLNVTFIRDEQGNPLGATVIAHDITERKRAEEALRGSEARLRAALDASGGAIYDHRVPLDESTYHDERWAKMLGYRPDELPPYHHFLDWLWEQVHPDDLGPLQRAYDDFVEGRNTSYHVEIRLRHKQGHWVWVQGHSHAVERDDSGRVRRIVGVMSDITPFKQVQNALRRLNTTLEQRVEERTQQVNALARRLTMAEQEERRRLSQVLHDDLQQLLYAVEMQMTVLGARLERAEDPGLAQDLEGVRALVKQAISRTRQLTVDLSPPILQDEGLADALGWLQGQMQELHGLYVDLEAAHSFQLADADLRVLLFQIVRELLFNVVKHAGVDRATVRLVEDGQTGTDLAIHVIDQGCGFDVQEVLDREQPAGGFGLYSARERLRLLGGRLEIHSRPGGGTHVEVHAPMQ